MGFVAREREIMKTNHEIASTWPLWAEYAGNNWTEQDFSAMTYEERIAALHAMFGPEAAPGAANASLYSNRKTRKQ